jgi:hypothetical protein
MGEPNVVECRHLNSKKCLSNKIHKHGMKKMLSFGRMHLSFMMKRFLFFILEVGGSKCHFLTSAFSPLRPINRSVFITFYSILKRDKPHLIMKYI